MKIEGIQSISVLDGWIPHTPASFTVNKLWCRYIYKFKTQFLLKSLFEVLIASHLN